MGRDRAHQGTPNLFSTPSLGDTSRSATKQVTSISEQRHVLPKDLPNSVKHLTDRELDLLITAAVEEAKRRGRAPPIARADESAPRRSLRTDHRRQGEVAALSLTRGQINAVRAAFKAGIKASLIARQFGISQSDVRKVLASDEER
jgi:predicted DNA binding protein